jgi:hypothetical protein
MTPSATGFFGIQSHSQAEQQNISFLYYISRQEGKNIRFIPMMFESGAIYLA